MIRVSFVCVPDVHGALSRLSRVVEFVREWNADAVLATGGFGNVGSGAPTRSGCERILAELGVPVFSVPGNHDPPGSALGESLHRRLRDFRGVRLYGIGGGGPQLQGFPSEWTDAELARLEIPHWDLLLSHSPPGNTSLDRNAEGVHVGSQVLRRQVEAARGAFVCGHIHEAVGAEVVGNCLCYNAGSLGLPFGSTQVGRLEFETDGSTRTWSVQHFELFSSTWKAVFQRSVSWIQEST